MNSDSAPMLGQLCEAIEVGSVPECADAASCLQAWLLSQQTHRDGLVFGLAGLNRAGEALASAGTRSGERLIAAVALVAAGGCPDPRALSSYLGYPDPDNPGRLLTALRDWLPDPDAGSRWVIAETLGRNWCKGHEAEAQQLLGILDANERPADQRAVARAHKAIRQRGSPYRVTSTHAD